MTKTSGKSDHNVHRVSKLRESYQKMIVELQNNHHKDKDKIRLQHEKELEALVNHWAV